MRLLIQSRNRWTFELLTSTKNQKVDCLAGQANHTVASQSSTSESIIRPPNSNSRASSSDTQLPVRDQKTNTDPLSTLSRRKSIRKRLGRFLFHFTRTHPDVSCNAYAYQYNGDASELPAGGIPIEGSATIQEMPASLSNRGVFEMEQPQLYNPHDRYPVIDSPYDQTSHGIYQSYCKPNYTGELAMFRGTSQVATPQQLPRLAVPGSLHDLPSMITDQSPVSASSISPNTPVGHFNKVIQPYWNLQPAPHTVSPCDVPNSQWYSRSRSQDHHTQYYLESPMTISPAGSSNATTPMSAHPTSACASFGAWPQLGPEYLQSAFPQRCQPMSYESNTENALNRHPYIWMTDVNPHPYRYYNSALEVRTQAAAPDTILSLGQSCDLPDRDVKRTNEKPLCRKSQLLPAIHIHDTTPHIYHEDYDAPPAYSPIVPNPPQYPPATCQHCGKSFTGKYGPGNCKRHVQQTHGSILDRAIHMCKVCMKTYNRADALRKHSWKKHRQEDARPNKRRR